MSKKLKIGFTGTQTGMTIFQKFSFMILMHKLDDEYDVEFHHGDCVGADADAHRLAEALGIPIVIHPPINDKARAFCGTHVKNRGAQITFKKLKGYIERNHDIVDACDTLIATPKSENEVLRSGTWATIRYAKKNKIDVIILEPLLELHENR